jgi:hypothetical protein
LQMMLAAPEFLGRAHISPVSEILTAGLIIGGLQKATGLGKTYADGLLALANIGKEGQVGGQRELTASSPVDDRLLQNASFPIQPGKVPGAAGAPPVKVDSRADNLLNEDPAVKGLATEPDPAKQSSSPTKSIASEGLEPAMRGLGAERRAGRIDRIYSTDGTIGFNYDPVNRRYTQVVPTPDANDSDNGELIAGSASSRKIALGNLYSGTVLYGKNNPAITDAARRDAAPAYMPSPGGEDRDLERECALKGVDFWHHPRIRQRGAQAEHAAMMTGVRAFYNGQRGNNVTAALRDAWRDMWQLDDGHPQIDNPWELTGNPAEDARRGRAQEKFNNRVQRAIALESDFRNPDSGEYSGQQFNSSILANRAGASSTPDHRRVLANPNLSRLNQHLQEAGFEGLLDFWNNAVWPEYVANYDARHGAGAHNSEAAPGIPGPLNIMSAKNDLMQKVIPKVGMNMVRALAIMKREGIPITSIQDVKDFTTTAGAMGNTSAALDKTGDVFGKLFGSLPGLRSHLGPGNPNGENVGQLFTNCVNLGLDVGDTVTQQEIVADVMADRHIDAGRARVILSVRNNSQARATGAIPTVTPTVEMRDFISNNAAIMSLRGDDKNVALSAVPAYLEAKHGAGWHTHNAPEYVVRSVVAYANAGGNPTDHQVIDEISMVAMGNGNTPQSYQRGARVVSASRDMVNAAPPGFHVDRAEMIQLVNDVASRNVNVSAPQTQQVLLETLQNQPNVLVSPVTREIMVRSVALAANALPTESLTYNDIVLAQQVIGTSDRAPIERADINAQNLFNTVTLFGPLYGPAAPDATANRQRTMQMVEFLRGPGATLRP